MSTPFVRRTPQALVWALVIVCFSSVTAFAAGAPAQGDGAHDPMAHEHWSIFQEILPAAAFENMSNLLGQAWLDPSAPPHSTPIFMVGLVLLLGFGVALSANRRMKNPDDVLLPTQTWSPFTIFDLVIEGLLSVMEGMMTREQALRFLPLIVSFFVFILMCNAMAMIPGMLPPTDNLNLTATLGIIAFLAYNWWGIRQQGIVAHFGHLMGPVWWLAWLIFPIEVISHLVRPASLALRLAGNMFGDHQVLGIFLGFQALGFVLVPLPVMLLGTVVIIVQAVVFTLLTIVYISMAVEEHGDHDAEHGAAH